jgi:putative cardiolipin synthase
LEDLRQRNVRVRAVTNSLEFATDVAAQAGYVRYRVEPLEDGVALHEIHARRGTTRGSGQTAVVPRYRDYSLHAKLFVLHRKTLFIGSMNFDQRSKPLKAEIGLILDSPELVQQTAGRFDVRQLIWHTIRWERQQRQRRSVSKRHRLREYWL